MSWGRLIGVIGLCVSLALTLYMLNTLTEKASSPSGQQDLISVPSAAGLQEGLSRLSSRGDSEHRNQGLRSHAEAANLPDYLADIDRSFFELMQADITVNLENSHAGLLRTKAAKNLEGRVHVASGDVLWRTEFRAESFEVRRGQNFDGILEKAGLTARQRFSFVQELEPHIDFRRLAPGVQVFVYRAWPRFVGLESYRRQLSGGLQSAGSPGQELTRLGAARAWLNAHPRSAQELPLRRLEVRQSPLSALSVHFDYRQRVKRVERLEFHPRSKLRFWHGEIDVSLWQSALDSGLNAEVIAQLAEILGWQIDFSREIRKGDRWKLVVEEHWLGEEKVGYGNIQALRFQRGDQTYYGFLEKSSQEGEASFPQYFDEEGHSLRGLFLRSPIEFARISSGFSRRRFHPILKIHRPHRGIDYAARPGTPVRTVGSGRVKRIRRTGACGISAVIKHGSTYETVYCHMRGLAKGLRVGKSVEQGEVIGYVGSTGLSTGPHLHFEFKENGRHIDPLGRRFPRQESLQGERLAGFKPTMRAWKEWIDQPEMPESMWAEALQAHKARLSAIQPTVSISRNRSPSLSPSSVRSEGPTPAQNL